MPLNGQKERETKRWTIIGIIITVRRRGARRSVRSTGTPRGKTQEAKMLWRQRREGTFFVLALKYSFTRDDDDDDINDVSKGNELLRSPSERIVSSSSSRARARRIFFFLLSPMPSSVLDGTTPKNNNNKSLTTTHSLSPLGCSSGTIR